MAEFAVISSKLADRFKTRLPDFLIEANKHLPVIDELIEKCTLEQLQDLAGKLPFVESYAAMASGLGSSVGRKTLPAGTFHRRIASLSKDRLAFYCACASRYLSSRQLTQVERLKERELHLINELTSLLNFSESLKCDGLLAYMKDHTEKETDDAKIVESTRALEEGGPFPA
jgi:hypothetical protein